MYRPFPKLERRPAFERQSTEELHQEFFRTKNERLREELMARHYGLAYNLAQKYSSLDNQADLIQVALIGLIDALDRFDPDYGTRFDTYAYPTIDGNLKRYLRDKCWDLKVSRQLREKGSRLARKRAALSQTLGHKATIPEVANAANISEKEAGETLEALYSFQVLSLDALVASEIDPDSEAMSLGDLLTSSEQGFEAVNNKIGLIAALGDLDGLERSVIYQRFFQGKSQTELARSLNISQMQVSRLQHRGLGQLRRILNADIDQ